MRCGFASDLDCALPVQRHLGHGDQHLLVNELRLSLAFNLLTLCYQLVQVGENRGSQTMVIEWKRFISLLVYAH